VFKTLRPSLIAMALVAAPAALAAQGTPAAPQQAPAAPQQQAPAQQTEMQQIQARLQEIQARALQDPTLKAAQDSIGTEMTATMERLDPTFKAQAARAEALKAEVAAAQTARDNAKLNQLAAEATQLQQGFATARQRAIQDPAMAARIKSFQERIVAKMNEVEPQTQTLLARLQELRGAGAPAQQPRQ
jgi:chromosome segregation ATPase